MDTIEYIYDGGNVFYTMARYITMADFVLTIGIVLWLAYKAKDMAGI